jgi:hypothetical protein
MLRLAALLVVGKAVVILAVYALDPSTGIIRVMGSHWDSDYYEIIATGGYGKDAPYVFSPVYPALIRLVYLLVGNAWASGLLVTNALSFVFPLLVYRTFGYRTALLAEVFPTYLVFTTVAYSDVVALVLLAASISLLMRERVTGASLFFSAAVLTFFNLAWTLPSFVFALLRRRRLRNLLFYVAPLATGLALILWFKHATGQYFPLVQLEKPWDVGFGTPLQQAEYLLCPAGHGSFTCESWAVDGVVLRPAYWLVRNLLFEAYYIYGALYLVLRTKLEHRVFLSAYSLTVIVPLLFMLGTPALSIPRLLLPAFPVFVSYAERIKGRWQLSVYVVVCLVLAGVISLIEYFALFA